ncbi:MAG TPA: hypothetical protein PK794_11820 [Armatimonadota bacterium]|nr:hypothetical protein [Armatimonadota bacterium]
MLLLLGLRHDGVIDLTALPPELPVEVAVLVIEELRMQDLAEPVSGTQSRLTPRGWRLAQRCAGLAPDARGRRASGG